MNCMKNDFLALDKNDFVLDKNNFVRPDGQGNSFDVRAVMLILLIVSLTVVWGNLRWRGNLAQIKNLTFEHSGSHKFIILVQIDAVIINFIIFLL